MAALQYQVYKVIDHIKDREAYTYEDLAYELKMHPKTAYRHLRELWSLDLVYICGWDRVYQQWVPAYRWGNKPDVEKPAAYTPTEKSRRARERKRERESASQSA